MDSPVDSATIVVRPITYVDGVVDPVDLAHAVRLVLGCEQAVLGRLDSSADDVVRMLSVSSTDRDNSGFVVDGDDVVGFLWIEQDPYELVTSIDPYTLPWPGTESLRSALLARGLDVARARRTESGSTQWKARAGGYVDDTSYAAVMTGAGMSPARRFYRMSIDSTSHSIPDTMPELPTGVAIVPGAVDDESRHVVHQLDRDAFSEHWGWADYPYDDWWEHMSASPSFDPDDWWLLTVDGVPAAICLLGNGRAQHNEGYVQVLGVLKEFRGRGLAQLLLRRAFVHYRDQGRVATLLGVDATNTTGAVALYEKVGMSPVMVMEAYEHPLD
jgi:ribosomal protein S18 acetylase RimI-like enzyme